MNWLVCEEHLRSFVYKMIRHHGYWTMFVLKSTNFARWVSRPGLAATGLTARLLFQGRLRPEAALVGFADQLFFLPA